MGDLGDGPYDITKPYSIYHAPNQNYYYMGDDWYGYEGLGQDAAMVEEGVPETVPVTEEIVAEDRGNKTQRRAAALHAIRAGTGLLATGGLIYCHRKREIDWYCSILASLVLGGLVSGAVTGVTGAVWNAADPLPEKGGV
jgi:hypothetical protein